MLDKTPVRHWLPQAPKCTLVTSAILLLFSVLSPATRASPRHRLHSVLGSSWRLLLTLCLLHFGISQSTVQGTEDKPSFTRGLFAHAQIWESSTLFLF